MSATAAERAQAFVEREGDALEGARAVALRNRSQNPALLERLAVQSADDLEGASRLLWLCTDASLLASPLARHLGGVLLRAQAADGAWRSPGDDLDAALRRTGLLAGCLARSPFARPEMLDAAGDFLAAHWDPDRVSDGRWAELRAYACYFANAPHERGDEVLQWCGRELERGFRTRVFDAVATMRVLVDCDAHSLPGASFASGELLVALLTEQGADGSFGSAAEAAARVASTLDGLHALVRFQPA